MFHVELSRVARDDIRTIYSYIANESVGRAQAFIERLLLRFELLARHPHAGRLRPEVAAKIRSTAIKPTVVFYRVFSDESRLEIVRIIDGRRDLGTIFVEDA